MLQIQNFRIYYFFYNIIYISVQSLVISVWKIFMRMSLSYISFPLSIFASIFIKRRTTNKFWCKEIFISFKSYRLNIITKRSKSYPSAQTRRNINFKLIKSYNDHRNIFFRHFILYCFNDIYLYYILQTFS